MLLATTRAARCKLSTLIKLQGRDANLPFPQGRLLRSLGQLGLRLLGAVLRPGTQLFILYPLSYVYHAPNPVLQLGSTAPQFAHSLKQPRPDACRLFPGGQTPLQRGHFNHVRLRRGAEYLHRMRRMGWPSRSTMYRSPTNSV
jgi:hypothetical protein